MPRLACLLALLLLNTVRLCALEAWIEAAMAKPTPEYAKTAPAVVLLHEETYEFDAQGKQTCTIRHVVRILSETGKSRARFGSYYNSKTDRIENLEAWRLRPGTSKEYRSSIEWVNAAPREYATLYDEYRRVFCSLEDCTIAGDTFAVEVRTSGPVMLGSVNYTFGGSDPYVTERIVLKLPAGFSFEEKAIGGKALERTHPDAKTWIWSSQNSDFRAEESHMTDNGFVDTQLFVQLCPPAGTSNFRPRTFKSWSEVASWTTSLNEGQCDSSPELTAKAHALTQDCKDDLARIQAIASFVQKTRYIAVNENLLNGAGYVARKASKVLGLDYGDCKDKANLLRALLREVGISSHPVYLRSGGRLYTRREFPTSGQFNHAILGVKVDASVTLPATIDTAQQGRLLIIDPTSTFTHVGDLPISDQGCPALINAPGIDELIDLPLIPSENCFSTRRTGLITLKPDASMEFQGTITATGQDACALRENINDTADEKDREKLVRRELGAFLRPGSLGNYVFTDKPGEGSCCLDFTLTMTGYLQRPQKTMLIAKMDILPRTSLPVFPEKERKLAMQLTATCEEDEISLKLPEGLEVDQAPRPASLQSPYGAFTLSFEQKPGILVMHRKFTISHSVLPASEFSALKKFLSDVARADRGSVLLRLASNAEPK